LWKEREGRLPKGAIKKSNKKIKMPGRKDAEGEEEKTMLRNTRGSLQGQKGDKNNMSIADMEKELAESS
jgi:hypothetical protein